MVLVVGTKRIGFLILPFNNYGSCCRYKENKFGMRWRLEKEVVLGENLFNNGSIKYEKCVFVLR